MYKAVRTLLVGLMLSLGGGASALTFKSDGSVVQNDGTVVRSATSIKNNNKFASWSDYEICSAASKEHGKLFGSKPYFNEATRRQTNCDVVLMGNTSLCRSATSNGNWETRDYYQPNVSEAMRRGLTCGVAENLSAQVNSADASIKSLPNDASMEAISAKSYGSAYLCKLATEQDLNGQKIWTKAINKVLYVNEAERRGLNCGVKINDIAKGLDSNMAALNTFSNYPLCRPKGFKDKCFGRKTYPDGSTYTGEFKHGRRWGLGVLVHKNGLTEQGWWRDAQFIAREALDLHKFNQIASQSDSADIVKSGSSAAELELERQKRIQLEAELAALKAAKEEQKQTIAIDKQVPLITITESATDQRKGIIKGFASDNVQIAEVLVDGSAVNVASDGSFEWTGFVPATGKDLLVEAIDTAALASRQVVRLERGQTLKQGILRFDGLNPMSGKIVQANQNALALIVGISEYDRTNAPAVFADNDAQFFQDYAALKLGIPENNITTLVNGNAEQVDVLLSVKNRLSRAVEREQSDVYVFFAGHGLASDDGEKMYLLPYDGAPELLDKTAILRDELFTDIAAANPRSVTVFLDTCYSGTTRGPDMLIASRPISIRAKESAIPEGFTVMTAAAGDQTAKPLEEAKHGMFSYFLMKGMEGDADANEDNQITAGELHAYVQQNVIQQSSGSQTPELQGDADRVLVRFQ